jgi:hypothetical protein
MSLFAKEIAWQNYFSTQVAEADTEETEAEASMKTQEALIMLNGGKLTDARNQRDTDEVVKTLRKEHRVARARRKMLQVAMENRERNANLYSRELTRRIGREGPQRRADRWNP